jgi:hypothetical protein
MSVLLEYKWIVCTEDNEDFAWDASGIVKSLNTDFGWVIEMKIHMLPCDFLLLKTNLGLNFMREIKRCPKCTWIIDTKVGQVGLHRQDSLKG